MLKWRSGHLLLCNNKYTRKWLLCKCCSQSERAGRQKTHTAQYNIKRPPGMAEITHKVACIYFDLFDCRKNTESKLTLHNKHVCSFTYFSSFPFPWNTSMGWWLLAELFHDLPFGDKCAEAFGPFPRAYFLLVWWKKKHSKYTHI